MFHRRCPAARELLSGEPALTSTAPCWVRVTGQKCATMACGDARCACHSGLRHSWAVLRRTNSTTCTTASTSTNPIALAMPSVSVHCSLSWDRLANLDNLPWSSLSMLQSASWLAT